MNQTVKMKININQAIEFIASETKLTQAVEQVSLFDAMGRVLAQNVAADIDQPPFHKSAMDGYACRSQDLPGELKFIGTIAAGSDWKQPLMPGECVQIMTGAKVPDDCNCVVMQEDVDLSAEGWVKIDTKPQKTNNNNNNKKQ